MSMGESASTASNNGASAGTANRFDEVHLDIHGIDTAVFTAGPAEAAETVVFFHGAGTATGFDCLLPIAVRRRLVVAHHPGFGASGDPSLGSIGALARHQLDVLDTLGIERCSIVGHSMGGWTAATLASFSTDRIDKLVLAAPAVLDERADAVAAISEFLDLDRT